MIDPKQLRLGNLLTDFKGQTVEVISIDKNLVITKPCGDPFFIHSVIQTGNTVEEILPIPLTEELLLKFGFESNPYQDRYEYKKWFFVECDKTRGKLELWFEFNNRNVELYYVHDLQNLYYSLTGEELQVSQNTKS